MLTEQQIEDIMASTGWTREQVMAVFIYWSHGGP